MSKTSGILDPRVAYVGGRNGLRAQSAVSRRKRHPKSHPGESDVEFSLSEDRRRLDWEKHQQSMVE